MVVISCYLQEWIMQKLQALMSLSIRHLQLQQLEKRLLDYGKSVINHGPAFGIQTSHQGRFCVVGGGLPLFVDGQIVGGIGCSSGSADQDIVVAQAGIDALLSAY